MTKTRATARNWGGARTGAGRKPGKKRLNVKGTVTSLKEHGEKRPDGRRNITEADQPCLQKVEAIFAQLRELTGASTNSEMLVIASQHPSLGVSSTDAQLAALRSRE